jgi:hypothetical protein
MICLQELWQFPNPSQLTFIGYNDLIYKLRRNDVQGGGVGIHVRKGLKFNLLPQLSTFVDRKYESILIETETPNLTKIMIGSVYIPGTHPGLSPVDFILIAGLGHEIFQGSLRWAN